MTAKPKEPNLNIAGQRQDSRESALAKIAIRPSLQGAATVRQYGTWISKGLDLHELASALSEQSNAVVNGDLNRGEAMLTAQAHTLDAIYNDLARRAINAELLTQFETFLKLGLRAQSQCRSTWEAISAIQNPRTTTFVKQANIAHGHQQVNNASRAEENRNPPNKLLEKTEHEPDTWMDPGTPETAERVDSAVETVGEIDGTTNGDGKE